MDYANIDMTPLRDFDSFDVDSDGKRPHVYLQELPQPFRAEFDAWLYMATRPSVQATSGKGGLSAYRHDFESYRQERLSNQWRKWGCPPWELQHFTAPLLSKGASQGSR
ncbi:hypothetical protein [Chitinimonas naiadis]